MPSDGGSGDGAATFREMRARIASDVGGRRILHEVTEMNHQACAARKPYALASGSSRAAAVHAPILEPSILHRQ